MSSCVSHYADGRTYLATGGRDRLIHIMDVTDPANVRTVDTLDDHSAAIHSIRFIQSENSYRYARRVRDVDGITHVEERKK